MTTWISTGSYCRDCGHSKSDHEYGPDGCAYGWTDEPDEPDACPCEAFVYGGENVFPLRDAPGIACPVVGR